MHLPCISEAVVSVMIWRTTMKTKFYEVEMMWDKYFLSVNEYRLATDYTDKHRKYIHSKFALIQLLNKLNKLIKVSNPCKSVAVDYFSHTISTS